MKVTIFYFTIAMGVSVIAGYLLEKFGFEKYIKAEAYLEPQSKGCSSGCTTKSKQLSKWRKVWNSTWVDFKKALPYLIGGIALGSLIYGFMPTEFVAKVANENNPFAIPIAAIIGIPLYIRAEAIIPLSAALAAKDMGLGAVMALIIGSAGASLTEVILLKSLFKNQMIITFLVVILSMAMLAGYLYRYLF
ncbi:MAG: permease, partial [Psychromonas sp.]|nr:permease [Psychromonas sp.]